MVLKVVLRNLQKHPFLNLVKVIGLGLALTGILFIALFLKNELTYDSYHQKSARTYRYTSTDPDFFSGKHFARIVNPGYIHEMSDALPELEEFVRLRPVRGGSPACAVKSPLSSALCGGDYRARPVSWGSLVGPKATLASASYCTSWPVNFRRIVTM